MIDPRDCTQTKQAKRKRKQNGRKVWLKVHYFVIWYPIENLLYF